MYYTAGYDSPFRLVNRHNEVCLTTSRLFLLILLALAQLQCPIRVLCTLYEASRGCTGCTPSVCRVHPYTLRSALPVRVLRSLIAAKNPGEKATQLKEFFEGGSLVRACRIALLA